MFGNDNRGMRPVDGSARLLSPSKPKISLRSVRSLPHSSSTPAPYTLLLYHIDNYAPQEPGCQQYEQLISALTSIERTLPFRSAQELVSKVQGLPRALVLTGTNFMSQQTVQQAGSLPQCDLLLLGDLRPVRQLLDPSVVMAGNEGGPFLKFLRVNGFDCEELQQEERRLSRRHSVSSTDFRNMMHKIMREDSEYSSNNNIFRSTFRSNSPTLPKQTLHWTVDHDPASTARFGTFALPNPSPKSPPLNVGSRVSPFSSTQPGWGGSSSEKTPLSSSYSGGLHLQERKEQLSQRQQNEQKPEDAKVSIQPMFWYEKKQLLPSKIINEVSEEYQLSKRSSLMFDPLRLSNQPEPTRIGRSRPLDNSLQLNSYLARQPSFPQPVPSPSPSANNTYKSPKVLKKEQPGAPEEVRGVGTPSKAEIEAPPPPPPPPPPSPPPTLSGSKREEKKGVQKREMRKKDNPILARTMQRQGVQSGTSSKATSPKQPKGNSPRQLPIRSAQISPQLPAKVTKPTENPRQTDSVPTQKVDESLKQPALDIIRRGEPKQPSAFKQQNPTSPKQPSSPESKGRQVVPAAFQNSLAKQFEGFQRIEKDGVVIYRRKTDKLHQGSFHQQALKPKAASPAPLRPKPQQRLQQTEYPSNPLSHPLPTQQPPKQLLDVKKSNPPVRAGGNESIMMSRLSELHSDGSILRRNNMRFGVKVREKPEVSMLWQESRLGSVMGKADGPVREMSRLLVGEQILEHERQKVNHIVTSISNFHFLVHEELNYLVPLLSQLASPNDLLQVFSSLEEMFQCLRPEKVRDKFDGGFIFSLPSHVPLLNPKILPEDYLLAMMDPSQGPILEFSPGARRLRLDHLKRLPLAQKLLLERKLYQCVAYKSLRPQIKSLAEMLGTELNVQRTEGEWSSEVLESYYCELPRLTRLYLLLEEGELGEVVRLLKIYKQFNPAFRPQSCKILCLLTDILPHDDLIMAHPTVTFLNNPEDLRSPQQVLHYAHYNQEPAPPLALDCLYHPRALTHLPGKLQSAFPGRFECMGYVKVGEAVDRAGKARGNQYLVLGEGGNLQKTGGCFRRVFSLGKGGIQSSMVRVLNLQELIEQLRYY